MKYLRLFENFEENPKSIVVEITPKFEEDCAEMKVTPNRSKGFTGAFQDLDPSNPFKIDKDRFELDGDRYVRVATRDRLNDIQDGYWASYEPESNEIYVCTSTTSGEETGMLSNSGPKKVLHDNDTIHKVQIDSLFKDKFHPGFYCKFKNGFKVGETDDKGYFKIVEVK